MGQRERPARCSAFARRLPGVRQRPKNVPHLRQGTNGAWFGIVRKELREAGCWFRDSACWTVNVKDAVDLPQDRERLFMVTEAGPPGFADWIGDTSLTVVDAEGPPPPVSPATVSYAQSATDPSTGVR